MIGPPVPPVPPRPRRPGVTGARCGVFGTAQAGDEERGPTGGRTGERDGCSSRSPCSGLPAAVRRKREGLQGIWPVRPCETRFAQTMVWIWRLSRRAAGPAAASRRVRTPFRSGGRPGRRRRCSASDRSGCPRSGSGRSTPRPVRHRRGRWTRRRRCLPRSESRPGSCRPGSRRRCCHHSWCTCPDLDPDRCSPSPCRRRCWRSRSRCARRRAGRWGRSRHAVVAAQVALTAGAAPPPPPPRSRADPCRRTRRTCPASPAWRCSEAGPCSWSGRCPRSRAGPCRHRCRTRRRLARHVHAAERGLAGRGCRRWPGSRARPTCRTTGRCCPAPPDHRRSDTRPCRRWRRWPSSRAGPDRRTCRTRPRRQRSCRCTRAAAGTAGRRCSRAAPDRHTAGSARRSHPLPPGSGRRRRRRWRDGPEQQGCERPATGDTAGAHATLAGSAGHGARGVARDPRLRR